MLCSDTVRGFLHLICNPVDRLVSSIGSLGTMEKNKLESPAEQQAGLASHPVWRELAIPNPWRLALEPGTSPRQLLQPEFRACRIKEPSGSFKGLGTEYRRRITTSLHANSATPHLELLLRCFTFMTRIAVGDSRHPRSSADLTPPCPRNEQTKTFRCFLDVLQAPSACRDSERSLPMMLLGPA